MSYTDELLRRYPIISDQIEQSELRTMLNNLESLLQKGMTGSVVEFGCYIGTTSLFITRLLQAYGSTAAFHVYDSFAGLPEKTLQDASPAGEQFKAGELAARKQHFIRNFQQAHLPLPVIHKGWFNRLSLADIPDDIFFAFLDGDYYESIQDSLRLVEKKLSKEAVIIVDDYQSEALPGARRATDAWLQNKDCVLMTAHSLAVIKTRG